MMGKPESYYDKNECRKRGCTDYKNQMCTDSVERRTIAGGLCCRYHKDALPRPKVVITEIG